jgi:amidase
VRAACEAAARRLAALGAHVEADAPRIEDPIAVYIPLYIAEVRRSLLPAVEPGELFQECLDEEASVPPLSAEDYVGALRRLFVFRSAMADFYERYDAIACPAAAVPAFPLREPPATIAGQAVTPGWTTFMPFPAAFNLCGQPSVTVPTGETAGGLPVGLMIAAAPGREDVCVRLAAALERDAR